MSSYCLLVITSDTGTSTAQNTYSKSRNIREDLIFANFAWTNLWIYRKLLLWALLSIKIDNSRVLDLVKSPKNSNSQISKHPKITRSTVLRETKNQVTSLLIKIKVVYFQVADTLFLTRGVDLQWRVAARPLTSRVLMSNDISNNISVISSAFP